MKVFSFPPAQWARGEDSGGVSLLLRLIRSHEDFTVIFLGFAASAFGITSLSTPSFIDA